MVVRDTKFFNAPAKAFWSVDGTKLTVVTNANIPLKRAQGNMRRNVKSFEQHELMLSCVHWSDSFQGVEGTHVHGHGWMLHVPKNHGGGDLWSLTKLASVTDWTQIR